MSDTQLFSFQSSSLNIKEIRLSKHVPLSKQQIESSFQAKTLYEKYGTLQKVANIWHISRERVRQLLERGEKYQLFKYTLTRERKTKDLIARVSKQVIINLVNTKKNQDEIAETLGISSFDLYRLLKYYEINTQDHILNLRTKRCLSAYSQIVDILGHHPSTTEMQSRKDWRNICMAIGRLWGSIDNFRNEYGIEKPLFAIHPNTIKAWKQSMEKRTHEKKMKIERLYIFIKNNEPIDLKSISKSLNLKISTLLTYLKELKKHSKITLVKKGLHIYYVTNNHSSH